MLSHTASELTGIHASRHDFEGARDWMAAICGPHGLQVQRPRQIQFNHSGTVLRAMACTLGYVEYGTDVTVSVSDAAPLNCYSLSLPLSGEQELAARGQLWHSDQNKGLIVSPHESQNLAISGNCRKMIVSIPRHALHNVLESLLRRPVGVPIAFEPSMDAVTGEQAAWWRMVKFFADELDRSSVWLNHHLMAVDLEQTLLKGLLLAQPHNYSEALADVTRPARPHYLQRAQQFIHDHGREEIALEDVEAAAGVSRYKLFEAFKEHFGLTPMAYLKRHRLEAVRRDLLAGRCAGNISSIALSWGFSHLGRFSGEYKALFGETPSDTLKRSSVRSSTMEDDRNF